MRRKIEPIDGYARSYGREPGEIAKSTTVPIWVGEPPAALLQRASGRAAQSLIAGDPAAVEARLRCVGGLPATKARDNRGTP
ncbi:MAG TPA: hypothetical protein VG370_24485 [Chloroflexota bacterium]|nr:hypothetical protein [Chloroflexota bacterium]